MVCAPDCGPRSDDEMKIDTDHSGGIDAKEFAKFAKDSGSVTESIQKLSQEVADQRRSTRRWRATAVAAGVLLIACFAGLFGLMITSQELAKESHVVPSARGSAALASKDGTALVATAPASAEVNLFHAVVLDAAHLQTIQRISYSYIFGNDTRTRTEALAGVERLEHTDANPRVVFSTTLGNTVTVYPGQIYLKEPGKMPKPLCGSLTCGQLAVEDLGIEAGYLEAQLELLEPSDDGGDDVCDACIEQHACEDEAGNCVLNNCAEECPMVVCAKAQGCPLLVPSACLQDHCVSRRLRGKKKILKKPPKKKHGKPKKPKMPVVCKPFKPHSPHFHFLREADSESHATERAPKESEDFLDDSVAETGGIHTKKGRR